MFVFIRKSHRHFVVTCTITPFKSTSFKLVSCFLVPFNFSYTWNDFPYTCSSYTDERYFYSVYLFCLTFIISSKQTLTAKTYYKVNIYYKIRHIVLNWILELHCIQLDPQLLNKMQFNAVLKKKRILYRISHYYKAL